MREHSRQESAPTETMLGRPEWVKVKERLLDTARRWTYTALVPAVETYSSVPLPNPLSPLCYVARPVRLCGKRTQRSFGRVPR